jgi:hypothetical protein
MMFTTAFRTGRLVYSAQEMKDEVLFVRLVISVDRQLKLVPCVVIIVAGSTIHENPTQGV